MLSAVSQESSSSSLPHHWSSSPAVRGPENELTMDSGSHYLVLVPSARPQEAFVRVVGSVVTAGLASR